MKRLMRLAILVGLVAAAGGMGLWAKTLFLGPEMKSQPHLRSFQATFPPVPAGVVPIHDPIPPVPTARQAATMHNPLDANSRNISRGRTDFGYYCAFCHGDDGAGHGPVGESYIPVPANLRDANTQALSDGELLRRMLIGIGHEPQSDMGKGHETVMDRIVPLAERWYLVLYMRRLPKVPLSPPVPKNQPEP